MLLVFLAFCLISFLVLLRDLRRCSLLLARKDLLPNLLLHGLAVDSLDAHSVAHAKDGALLCVPAQRPDLMAVEAFNRPSRMGQILASDLALLGLDAEPRHSLHDIGLERHTARFAPLVLEKLRLHLR